MKPKKPKDVRPRFRIVFGKDIAIGPGKADLLEAIAETGSIQFAARRLRMSYMRAWKLIQTMNRCFKKPIVATARGGSHGGETHLTDLGTRILKLYRNMERTGKKSTRQYWQYILRELKQ
jgi:molybdate transport system regulatory protein